MKVEILKEAGYEEAMLGLSLSFESPIENMPDRALKLANKDGGHNNFLESIYLWLDVTASLKWWKQADRYRLSTKQSSSTMHTILKRPLTQEDFESNIPNDWLDYLNAMIQNKNFDIVTDLLPSSFLQRRIWVMNYKCLRNIIAQRKNHKLKDWKFFCLKICLECKHREFLD